MQVYVSGKWLPSSYYVYSTFAPYPGANLWGPNLSYLFYYVSAALSVIGQKC